MPRVSQNVLDDILAKIDIVEVISSYIPLKKIGKSFKALCPFHNEKTSSFIVSQEKQIYHCFGCGVGGNAFNFLMQYERIEFKEALEVLARKAGISLPQKESNPEAVSLTTNLYKVQELAGDFFHNFLLKSPEAKNARDYLSKRKIRLETISKFKIGFAPNSWAGLLDFLRTKNLPISLIEKSGLIIPKNDGGYYDRFRNRLVFPIFDLKGRIAAFSARVLDNSLPKYINSPDTPIFSKSKLLYGFNLSKDHVREKDYLLIVEGNFDFISLYQAGILNTAATLGTALTSDHARIIKRFTKNIKVLFDGDKAGELAALRTFDIFAEEGLNIDVVTLDKDFDPDSYIVKFGIDKLNERLDKSEDFFEFKLEVLKSRFDIKQPLGKAEAAKEMLTTVKKIDNEILKSEYIRKLSECLDVGEQVLLDELKKTKTEIHQAANQQTDRVSFKVVSSELVLLKLILKQPEWTNKIKENIDFCDFNDLIIANIIKEVFRLEDNGEVIDIPKLMNQFNSGEYSNVISKAILSDEIDSIKDDRVFEKIIDDCLGKLKGEKIKAKRKDILVQIKIAQENNDQVKLKELLNEFQSCLK